MEQIMRVVSWTVVAASLVALVWYGLVPQLTDGWPHVEQTQVTGTVQKKGTDVTKPESTSDQNEEACKPEMTESGHEQDSDAARDEDCDKPKLAHQEPDSGT